MLHHGDYLICLPCHLALPTGYTYRYLCYSTCGILFTILEFPSPFPLRTSSRGFGCRLVSSHLCLVLVSVSSIGRHQRHCHCGISIFSRRPPPDRPKPTGEQQRQGARKRDSGQDKTTDERRTTPPSLPSPPLPSPPLPAHHRCFAWPSNHQSSSCHSSIKLRLRARRQISQLSNCLVPRRLRLLLHCCTAAVAA